MLVMRLFPRAACTLDSWHPELKSVRDLATYLKPDHPFWACCCAPHWLGVSQAQQTGPSLTEQLRNTSQPRSGSVQPPQALLLAFPSGWFDPCRHLAFSRVLSSLPIRFPPGRPGAQLSCGLCSLDQASGPRSSQALRRIPSKIRSLPPSSC